MPRPDTSEDTGLFRDVARAKGLLKENVSGSAERYFISIRVEERVEEKRISPHMVGIDLGLDSLVTLSTGEKVGAPQFLRKDEKRLAKAQRRLAKKKRGSMNREAHCTR